MTAKPNPLQRTRLRVAVVGGFRAYFLEWLTETH
jgi:hypothetical protein